MKPCKVYSQRCIILNHSLVLNRILHFVIIWINNVFGRERIAWLDVRFSITIHAMKFFNIVMRISLIVKILSKHEASISIIESDLLWIFRSHYIVCILRSHHIVFEITMTLIILRRLWKLLAELFLKALFRWTILIYLLKRVKKYGVIYLVNSFDIEIHSCTAVQLESLWVRLVMIHFTHGNLIGKFFGFSKDSPYLLVFWKFLLLIELSRLMIIRTTR